jgi:hypothetical protein
MYFQLVILLRNKVYQLFYFVKGFIVIHCTVVMLLRDKLAAVYVVKGCCHETNHHLVLLSKDKLLAGYTFVVPNREDSSMLVSSVVYIVLLVLEGRREKGCVSGREGFF